MAEETTVSTSYKTQAILGYFGILVLIPILTVKKADRDEFIKNHIKQGFGVFVVLIIGVLLQQFVGGIGNLVSLFGLVLEIMGIINAVKCKIAKLPLLGGIFDGFNFLND